MSERAGTRDASLAGLRTIAHVAGALVGRGTLVELGERALVAMREALALDAAVLYVADVADRPLLARYVASFASGVERRAADELAFDPEAWSLVIAGGRPVVFQEPAAWLVEHPFEPPADSWLVLPLAADGRLLGAVIASSPEAIVLDPAGALTLTLLGGLLSAGIANARMDQELARMEIERERMRLAAEIHDGLAQDLALAVRELALLDSGPDAETAAASRRRLEEAVTSAHRVVRSRLEDLGVSIPIGGLRAAVEEVCSRFADRGPPLELRMTGPAADVPPAKAAVVLRVLSEALTNVERHSGARSAAVDLRLDAEHAQLDVVDDGEGFAPEDVGGPGEGYFGLTVMAERARAAGGELAISRGPAGGTHVRLTLPVG